MTITPTAISFGATGLSSASASQSITVKNSGTAGLHISLVQVGGANASDFAVNNGCTAPVYVASAMCMFSITFRPSASGARSATLTITDDATGGTQTVLLTGTGTGGPAVTISTAAVSFAAIAIGTKSPQQNITINQHRHGAASFFAV